MSLFKITEKTFKKNTLQYIIKIKVCRELTLTEMLKHGF